MYRDDPLADEEELRDVLGDDAVDSLLEVEATDEEGATAAEAAVDVLRVLQGWVDDREAGRWFATPQQRLDGATPVEALASGATAEVRAAARRWAAAQG